MATRVMGPTGSRRRRRFLLFAPAGPLARLNRLGVDAMRGGGDS
jgi:hypothetical protein